MVGERGLASNLVEAPSAAVLEGKNLNFKSRQSLCRHDGVILLAFAKQQVFPACKIFCCEPTHWICFAKGIYINAALLNIFSRLSF
jgi:hypothetical protein